MHRATFSVGDTLSSTKQFTNDGFDCATTHEGETVTSIGRDDCVVSSDGMLDTDCDGFLASRQMAETTDFLLLV
jgi:hypothetical protein